MRRVILALLMTNILLLMVRCGENETLQLWRISEITTPPYTLTYAAGIIGPDSSPTLNIITDSLRWLYKSPPGEPSTLNIILSGKLYGKSSKGIIIVDSTTNASLNMDSVINVYVLRDARLEVETYLDGTINTEALACNDEGQFIDTVKIAATSSQSEAILLQDSRFFVKYGGEMLDIIPLTNPW